MKNKKSILRPTLLIVFLLLAAIGAEAASLTVNTTADAGTGSLRQALIDATTNAEANVVTFAIPTTEPGYNAGTNNFTISLLNQLPNFPLAPITFDNSMPQTLTVMGNGGFRIFTFVNSAVVTLNRIIVTNGFSSTQGGGIFMGNSAILNLNGSKITNNTAAGEGGGIYMSNSGTIHSRDSTISDNNAGNGGGIYIFDSGTLNLNTSTINNNTASESGGGVYNGISGTINAVNNTIDGNSAAGSGGGLYNAATITFTNNTVTSNSAGSGGGIYNNFTATLTNNLVALNSASDGPDLLGRGSVGSAFVGTYNLIGNADGSEGLAGAPNRVGTTGNEIDPFIGPLQNNGGLTSTRALLAGSPAIDKGNSPGITTDQRGSIRPVDNPFISNDGGDGSDIGAFEAGILTTTAASVEISGRVLTSDGNGLRNAQVWITDSDGTRKTVITSSLGYYSFTDVEAGNFYILGVASKRYRFETRAVSASDSIANFDFMAQE
ncbi:hypothetical protein BH20ACI2_BH20ACI2_00870 [soil metagenome]